MLMRFDPFREFDRLAQQVWRDPALTGGTALAGTPMDAYRRGDQFIVHFDLPGVDASSIDLSVEKNVLTVSANRERPFAEGDEVVVGERRYGHVTRQLFLGETLDTDAISASYDDGVLTLTLPVAEKAKPRKVEINAGSRAKEIAGTAR